MTKKADTRIPSVALQQRHPGLGWAEPVSERDVRPLESSVFPGALLRQPSIELSPGVHGDKPCDYSPNSR